MHASCFKYCLVIKMSSAKFYVCYKFHGTSKSLKVGENNVGVSTAWIRVRRRVTRRLIRIEAVCIWDYGRDRQKKGNSFLTVLNAICNMDGLKILGP